jgi:hypothetical protein
VTTQRHSGAWFESPDPHFVGAGKMYISAKKVEAIADWPMPTTQKEVRSFVQFCNFYAKFIHHFIDNTAQLADLLRKSHPHGVTQTTPCLEAFETLEVRVISAPCVMLSEVSSDAMFIVATNASTMGLQQSFCKTK